MTTTTRARIVLQAQDTTAPAFNSLKARLAAAQGEAAGLARNFAGVAAGVSAFIAGPALFVGFLKSVNDGLGALKDLSEATGASVENLSGLEDIARRTGTSFDTVGASLLKLNQALVNAGTDKRLAETFKAIGLSVDELKRQDPAQAFVATTRALDQFAEGGGRARAELLIFGRSLRDIAPLLREVAEAGQLNATVTREQVAEADAFNKQLSALGKNATDLARYLAGPVVASLNDFSDVLQRGFANQFASDFLRARIQATTDELNRIAPAVAGAREELDTPASGFFDALQKASAQKTLDDFDGLTEALRRYSNELSDLSGVRDAGGGRGFVNPEIIRPQLRDPNTPEPVTPTRSAPDPLQALIDSTTAARTERLIGLRQKLDAQFAAGKRSATEYARGLEAIDDALAALQPRAEAATDVLGDFIEKIESARAAEIAGIVGQSTGARVEALADQARLLAEAFEQGEVSITDFARGAEVLGQQFDGLAPRFEETAATISTFAEQAARNIQDTLGNTLLATLDGNFKSIGDLWADTIKRMVAEAAAAQLGQYLFGSTFATTGTLGGAIGGLFGGARATGGPVSPGRAYLVGEKGPELMVPRQAGTVVPNGAAVGATVAPVFAPVLHVNGDVSPQTIAAMRAEIGRWHARFVRQTTMQGGGTF